MSGLLKRNLIASGQRDLLGLFFQKTWISKGGSSGLISGPMCALCAGESEPYFGRKLYKKASWEKKRICSRRRRGGHSGRGGRGVRRGGDLRCEARAPQVVRNVTILDSERKMGK